MALTSLREFSPGLKIFTDYIFDYQSNINISGCTFDKLLYVFYGLLLGGLARSGSRGGDGEIVRKGLESDSGSIIPSKNPKHHIAITSSNTTKPFFH